MFTRIKEWWYAILVCRKYKAKLNPFRKCSQGAQFQIWYTDYGISKRIISINPFYKGFLDSFMHEVGHLVWYDKLASKSKTIEIFEELVDNTNILEKEFVAWRYAKLARKGKFDKQRSRKMFSTYFKVYAKDVGGVQAANVYSSFDMRIEK